MKAHEESDEMKAFLGSLYAAGTAEGKVEIKVTRAVVGFDRS